ncbi:MAG: TY-Chap domain-containing protein, partial [Phycicoccus sp.]
MSRPTVHRVSVREPWVTTLAGAVRRLDDGGSLVVTGPDDAARPAVLRRPRLRGFLPGRYRDTAPWVRLRRDDQHLRGWCVGSEAIGGGFPLAPEDHAALLGLGWHVPSSVEGADYLRWWPDDVPTGPYLPADDALRAACTV